MRHQALMEKNKQTNKQAYMNKLTTKKQMQMQTWWALVGERSKIEVKGQIWQFCDIFKPH